MMVDLQAGPGVGVSRASLSSVGVEATIWKALMLVRPPFRLVVRLLRRLAASGIDS
jgi:hypothetical protein